MKILENLLRQGSERYFEQIIHIKENNLQPLSMLLICKTANASHIHCLTKTSLR